MRHFCLVLSLVILSSCTGYRYSQTSNPFQQYGVDSLAIPMFYNFSSLPEVSTSFTHETYKLLAGFTGLKLKSGWDMSADAVLIGIVRSQEKMNEVLSTDALRSAQGASPNAVGSSRPDFYVAGTTRVNLILQVVVVKRPTPEEIELLRSNLGSKIPAQGKILFNESFPISESYNREIYDNEAVSVVGTQNAGVLRRTKDTMAMRAAEQIRDMILYAF
ncbi:MAG: hypothetical protein K2P81_10935 [Bacteriovoracaceae bacterium]|nr:hypothetical protein [Bacteriovoracaceae bacterium]